MDVPRPCSKPWRIDREGLQRLFESLVNKGYRLIGPTVQDGTIVYDEIHRVEDLPAGWTDRQGPGTYRLEKRADSALFGYAVGPHSWKRYLYPPSALLWQATRRDGSFQVHDTHEVAPRFAFIGVRACELHAMAIQDRVFLGGPYRDPIYQGRREQAFIVAVHCTEPSGACFCTSMGTGPRVSSGFDLALTEVCASGTHFFVVEVGSEAGAEVLKEVPHRAASAEEAAEAERAVEQAAGRMGRFMETAGLKELLYDHLEHPRWDQVAARCLSCGNCTMVCPTCFCSTVEDVTDLSGERAERWRHWDSCFTMAFSYMHGGTVRSSIRSRYRQWMIHKLATWLDQFGTLGCVGCGRCITWCPVGIDITEEVRAIRESGRQGSSGEGKHTSPVEGTPLPAGSP